MGKVRLRLQNMPILDKIALATRIVTAMTGNPNFVTPNPPLADITNEKIAAQAAYDDSRIKRQDSKLATEVLGDREKALDLKLTQIALYVENVSAGNETKISSAGMDVRDSGAPIGPLPIPTGLYATAGSMDGEIDLDWEPVYGANSYVVQMTTDPNAPESWEHKANATESYAVILGLTSGGKFWFRVAGVGAAGQGAFSDPAARYAP